MNSMEIKVKHTGRYKLPAYETTGAAGMDVRAELDMPVRIPNMEIGIIPTGLHCAVPKGYELQVRSRSGMAAKHKVAVLNSPGTIDSDYRGEIKVILYNGGSIDFTVEPGDRIAQLVLAPVIQATWKSVDDLDETERGLGGFGSTGVKDKVSMRDLFSKGRSEYQILAKEMDYDSARMYEKCDNPGFIFYWAAMIGVDRKTLIKAAVGCAETAMEYTTNIGTKTCAEVVRRWCNDEATLDEVINTSKIYEWNAVYNPGKAQVPSIAESVYYCSLAITASTRESLCELTTRAHIEAIDGIKYANLGQMGLSAILREAVKEHLKIVKGYIPLSILVDTEEVKGGQDE